MVYDNTEGQIVNYTHGFSGFAIHENQDPDGHTYQVFTDDGRGNGDYVCGSDDLYWIRRIASSLDWHEASQFGRDGFPR